MDLSSAAASLYLRHAFAGMDRVLDRLDDQQVNRKPEGWGTNSVAGLIVHCCELAPSWFEMPGLGRDSDRDREREFSTTATVAELRARIAASIDRSCALIDEFATGPTVTDHPFREFMPGTDRTDGALVLHVLEELFQHLGHMEVTADALAHTTERGDEVAAAVANYRALREAIGRGERPWSDMAELFTDDAIYIDPAWGRIEGRNEIRAFIEESMTGLDDWAFPIEYIAVDGDNVVVKWTQVLPGVRPDGSHLTQSGYSTLIYAGDGRFSYEEDLLNMTQVIEDIIASGWVPGDGFTAPPPNPNRDVSRPT